MSAIGWRGDARSCSTSASEALARDRHTAPDPGLTNGGAECVTENARLIAERNRAVQAAQKAGGIVATSSGIAPPRRKAL